MKKAQDLGDLWAWRLLNFDGGCGLLPKLDVIEKCSRAGADSVVALRLAGPLPRNRSPPAPLCRRPHSLPCIALHCPVPKPRPHGAPLRPGTRSSRSPVDWRRFPPSDISASPDAPVPEAAMAVEALAST